MDNYNYHKGMNVIIQELKYLLKTKSIGTDSDRPLLLDFQAALETKPEKAIKLEKDALALVKKITEENAHLVSNLHSNLGGLYRMNGYPDLAKEYMEKGISVLQKLSGIIKEYLSDDCLNYAKVQETLGTIYLMTANHSKAKTHLKKAFKIYEKIWTDEPEMIEAKYQEIQELYPQVGSFLGQQISNSLTKQA